MKRFIGLFVFVFCLSMVADHVALAQGRGRGGRGRGGRGGQERVQRTPEDRAKAHVKRLDKGLELTKEQEDKAYHITLVFNKEMESMKDQRESLSREEMRTKMTAARKTMDSDLQKILTDEQKKKYAEIKQTMADRRKERRDAVSEKRKKRRASGENSRPESID
ncbi:hypothetical protein FUAX_52300 (plasmid) [Fulvitalea axinellae]|uniref:Periplasmic heavy metal sensor n=1 Tax=Fulvitalea axinellae TaxID=1182444 RepID=A0AAU9CXY0_9BACT|nr:hypothetical protein FUAX_52300 [Fulvitalea axinellae]